jgi:hypothetical protein
MELSAKRGLLGLGDQVRSMVSMSLPQFAALLPAVLPDPTDPDLGLCGNMVSNPGFSGVTIRECPRLRQISWFAVASSENMVEGAPEGTRTFGFTESLLG